MEAQALIVCWELGRRRHPLDRALLLHAAAEPDADCEALADRPLGERNAALLRLRSELFGDALQASVDCPACCERLEFTVSARSLLPCAAATRSAPVEHGGRRVRMPTTRDLAAVANEPDEPSAQRKLLERLLETGSLDGCSSDDLAAALDAADPCLDVSLDLSCPACAHAWATPLDLPGFLWEEIEVRVRRLLDEVHTLAHAYHWNEEEILALSGVRRSAYLQRVLA